MHAVLIVLYVFVCMGLIGLVLIQHGKGADAGAAFGSGASSTVFGSQGSGSFLTRLTAGLATAFFVLSLVLVYFVSHGSTKSQSVTNIIQPTAPVTTNTPVTPAPANSNTITIPVNGGDLPPQPASGTAPATPSVEVTTTPATGAAPTPAPSVEVTTTPATPAPSAETPATPPAPTTPPANQ